MFAGSHQSYLLDPVIYVSRKKITVEVERVGEVGAGQSPRARLVLDVKDLIGIWACFGPSDTWIVMYTSSQHAQTIRKELNMTASEAIAPLDTPYYCPS